MPSICLVAHEHTSASTYYRATLPVRHCREPLAAEGIELVIAEPGADLDGHDAYCFYRAVPVELYPFVTRCVASGVPVAYDVDDLFMAIPEWSPAFKMFDGPHRAVAEQCVGFADLVSASTAPLADALGHRDKTTVLPNLIDPADWPTPSPRCDGRCVLLWQGSATHEEDLRVALPALLRCREELGGKLTIAFAGYCPPWVRDDRYLDALYLGGWPIASHARALSLLSPDVGIAPLSDSDADLPFNRCKSAIKVWEYAMAGATVVASDVGPYRGGPGFRVANHRGAWHDLLPGVCRSAADGRFSPASGRSHVVEHHSWANPDLSRLWCDHFRSLARIAEAKP